VRDEIQLKCGDCQEGNAKSAREKGLAADIEGQICYGGSYETSLELSSFPNVNPQLSLKMSKSLFHRFSGNSRGHLTFLASFPFSLTARESLRRSSMRNSLLFVKRNEGVGYR
jgi:hypothetical protein